jgi:DNA adenine methylase
VRSTDAVGRQAGIRHDTGLPFLHICSTIYSMKPASKKLRPAVKTPGGKAYLARRIVALIPEHTRYIEPFAGGASVLLNKPRCPLEMLCDRNDNLINFYRVLRDDTERFLECVRRLEYSLQTFNYVLSGGGASEFWAAVQFLVRRRMSRGGLGKTFAWSERLRGGQPGDLNAWQTMVNRDLPLIAERLQGVEVVVEDALQLLSRELSDQETLIYADPPYVHSTRTATKVYGHYEMNDWEHEKLLNVLCYTNSRVMLSGYHSELYDRMLKDWTCYEFPIANHSGQGKSKQRRIECLWINPTR